MRTAIVLLLLFLIVLLVQCNTSNVLATNSVVEQDFDLSDALASIYKRIHLGSFNIQVFGLKKLSDPQVTRVLLQILSRYDICLIQEIRDSSESAIFSLVDKLNAYVNSQSNSTTSSSPVKNYKVAVSERLGRTNSKEQYAFLYDSNRFRIVDTFQFNTSYAYSWFERPPYSVIVEPLDLSSTQISKENFYMFLTGVHIQPSKAAAEIERMVDVYDYYMNNVDIPMAYKNALLNRYILMGDLNAGCGYVSKTALSKLKSLTPKPSAENGGTATDPKPFVWLISDTTDTTVSSVAQCPYDRFICTEQLLNPQSNIHIQEESIISFEFGKAYGLSHDLTKKVSDHYPIELTIEYEF